MVASCHSIPQPVYLLYYIIYYLFMFSFLVMARGGSRVHGVLYGECRTARVHHYFVVPRPLVLVH